ncbi:aspartic protease [Rhodotorula sp. JG-1b]|nr:aspartic protease [Rhodotorula sp. JG-1b]
MRTAALFATVALMSMPSTFAAPTPRSEPEPIVVLPEDSPCRGTAIPLGRRAVASDLTRADGTVDLNKAHLQLARARAKFTRGLANFRSNMGEAHFLSPDLVDPSLLPGSPSFPAESSSSSSGAADTDVPVSAPAVKRRRDKIFGESGIRLHGVPPSASTPPSSNGSFANRRALERRAVPNPKVIPNPKWTGSTAAGNSAKTGNVGLTNYGEGTIFYGSLKIGSSAQSFSVNIDTGSADLWLPSASCNSAACNAHTKYDPSQSTTSSLVSGRKLTIVYGDGSSTSGVVYTDAVTFGGLTATSQAVGVATSLSSDFQDDPYDGLVGMAYGSISTMGVTPLFQTLVSQGRVAKSQFSTYLASSGSELFLGGMNSAHFAAGSTHWYPVISQGYWTLAAKAAVNNKVVSSLGTFSALVDTGTSVIVAPTAAAKQFWAAVPNSATYGSGGYWTYPCASPPTISFSFGGAFAEQWAVSSSALNLGRVSSGSDRCVGAVVGADIGINAWILGDSFLQSVYTTFDFSTNQVGFSDLS